MKRFLQFAALGLAATVCAPASLALSAGAPNSEAATQAAAADSLPVLDFTGDPLPDPAMLDPAEAALLERLGAAADSIWGVVPVIEVAGATTSRTATPGRAVLDAVALARRDVSTVADLGPLLPATRVNVNSRGESQFMVRGAPERHVRVLLDGVPLTVPWDERSDLSMLPAEAIGTARVARGPGGALAGPQALAGVVELLPAELPSDGTRTRLGLRAGESRLREAHLLHLRRDGSWQLLAAAARRQRTGFVVPEELAGLTNQGPGRERAASDLEQTSMLLRLRRNLQRGGVLRLTLAAADGEKGVPPELHLGQDARFWRYPEVRRAWLGLAFDTPLDSGGDWELATDVSLDAQRLEIRPYDDISYSGPALAEGVDYETNTDRTAQARARVTRTLGPTSTVAVQATARYGHHREALQWQGPRQSYAQWLGSIGAEASAGLGRRWRMKAGAGWEAASTPETGDKPAREADGAEVVHVRAERGVGAGALLHLTAARRHRFPALRELYSGALGRFVPNPDLAPERLDHLEAGLSASGARWEAGLSLFADHLRDGIERVALTDAPGLYQRVNVDRIRTLGLELAAAGQPAPRLSLSAHHTVLAARRQIEGEYAARAEDRPDWLSLLAADWSPIRQGRLGLELAASGPRWSADGTATDGLRRLPAQAAWNARAAWVWLEPGAGVTRAELYVRVNNLLDRMLWAQTGLPEAGRTLMAGVDLRLDRWR